MTSALADVRVIECCDFVAGPFCSKLLADLGADVVKIEPPEGDSARRHPPFLHDQPSLELSGMFLWLNSDKRGITLRLDMSQGREVFQRLTRDADILIEDHAPGWMEAHGLDYASLAHLNPRLVVTSITPFGAVGPRSDWKAHPLNVFHAGGAGYIIPGDPDSLDRPPLQAGGQLGEYNSGLTAAIATLGALYNQRHSGHGQHIDLSKQEATLAVNRSLLREFTTSGIVPSRKTSGYPYTGDLPCKDGYFSITAPEEEQWQRLVEMMGNPPWSQDERYKTRQSRTQRGKEVNQFLIDWLKDKDKADLYREAQKRGIPVGPVCTAQDVVESPQLAQRGFFKETPHPEAGRLRYPTGPYVFSETPVALGRPAPLLGEHTEEVLTDRLGYSREEVARLRAAGVI